MVSEYNDSKKFMARVNLRKRFSTNSYGWLRWLYDQLEFPPHAKVLELGCGNALLWKENSYRLPDGQIVLSDISEGMLKAAKTNLEDLNGLFEFKLINAEEIPYEDETFDVVIANNMLYHVPNLDKALAEINRVLTSEGILYAATFSVENMKELNYLLMDYNPRSSYTFNRDALIFGLENGSQRLGKFFRNINLKRYNDSLVITEAKPLADFILSFEDAVEIVEQGGGQAQLETYISGILDKNQGEIAVTKQSGLFSASKSGTGCTQL